MTEQEQIPEEQKEKKIWYKRTWVLCLLGVWLCSLITSLIRQPPEISLMEFLVGCVRLIMGLACLASIIAFFKPLPKLGLTTKTRAVCAFMVLGYLSFPFMAYDAPPDQREKAMKEAFFMMVGFPLSLAFLAALVSFFKPLPKLGLTTRKRAWWVSGVIAPPYLLVLLSILPTPEELAAQAVAERQERLANLDKWADRYDIDAESLCSHKIEKSAKYDFEWTTGFAERIWSRWQWADVDKKILRYYGDKIKFQNGLGVYGQHHYFCEYDIDAEKIIKVSVHPGRMF